MTNMATSITRIPASGVMKYTINFFIISFYYHHNNTQGKEHTSQGELKLMFFVEPSLLIITLYTFKIVLIYSKE